MKFLISKLIQTDVIIHVQYIGPYVKCRLFLLDFNISWNVLAHLCKILKKFMKTLPLAEKFFMRTHRLTDWQTDITMLIVRFHIFVNDPKNI